MHPGKLIIIVGSTTTMSKEDWDRLLNSNASPVDNIIPLIPFPLIPSLDPVINIVPEKRGEKYWLPKHDRLHKRK